MFFHLYITRIKCLAKNKSLFFWSLCYPIILGTLFFAGFGNTMDLDESFQTIPVALVTETDTPSDFLEILNAVSDENNQKLFHVTETDKEAAMAMLNEKEVDGIILLSENPTLIVKSSGMNQSILKSFMDQYQQSTKIISEISTTKPESLTSVIESLNTSSSVLNEVNLNGISTNALIQYYYALMAMTCMLGCYYGLKNTQETQANQSTIAARRAITPTHKMFLIITETLAAITIHYSEIVLVFLYLRFVLRIPIGDQPVLFLLCCFVGCLIGVCLGQFLGAIVKGGEQLKTTLLTAITLILSFLSGLMIATIPNAIEKNIPVINRINPTTLLTDAFYCLTVYNDYNRFFRNLLSLVIMAIFFSIACFIVTRREKYASI
ncbi:ABC transporter permease [Clostridium sp. Marseille-P299]|uniref:ABC transporter permease n=1 Tax=Clostridium sp. Marseille-P299 TaxID=1805477 RepID=UPI000832E274|nr:ABC transporter permease [Clostridium sp. Marseille-P299]